jgi:predicted DCC family thiol-disulfide oxidoreductase YuxK
MAENNNNTAIILFDGVCNFCNSSVNFIIVHDKKNYFKFTPLQSDLGIKLLEKYNFDNSKTDSVILIENDNIYTKSTAALKISKHLNRLYSLLYILIIIPTFIRNFVYDIIAKNRYKWFGKKDSCMMPSAEIKSKFLS